jgi:metal-responsive CopG/Arc/MetJ family transcriptional regulator
MAEKKTRKLKEEDLDKELNEFIQENETRSEAYTKMIKEFIKRIDPENNSNSKLAD